MKVGLRFDKAAMQHFLLEHVEKIGMVVVVCLAALVLYVTFAYRDLSYAKQPDMLMAQAEQAQQHWGATKPDDVSLPQLPNYGIIAGRSGQRTNPTLYSLTNPWEQQPFEQLHPRGMPELYAAEDLRARAFRTVDRTVSSNTDKAGKHFIVVTGAIPAGEQSVAFHRAYDRASKKSTTGDEPRWSAVFVQRAEVLPNQSASEFNWSPPINLRQFAEKSGGMGGGANEVFVDRYIDPALTTALPGLDKESYPPEIYSEKIAGPLYSTVAKNPEAFKGRKVTWRATSDQRESTTLTATQRLYYIPSSVSDRGETGIQYYVVEFPTEQAANAFSRLTAVTGIVAGGTRQQVSEPAGGKTESREVEAPLLKFWMPADIEARFKKLAEEQPRHSITDMVERNSGSAIDPALQAEFEQYLKPEYLLLRFVDLDVEPGKEYVYRVQLVLENPNYRMEPAYLENASTAVPQYVPTDWSKPTEPVLVPRNTQIVLGSVVPPPQPTSDLRAKVALVRWLGDTGETVSKDFPVMRGAVLDFEKTAVPEADRKTITTTPSNPVVSYDWTTQFQADPSLVAQDDTAVVAEKPKGPNPDEFDFFTGAMVVDLAGGDSLVLSNRRTSAPGEMLLMMPNGNFVVHDQLSDEPKWKEHLDRNSHK